VWTLHWIPAALKASDLPPLTELGPPDQTFHTLIEVIDPKSKRLVTARLFSSRIDWLHDGLVVTQETFDRLAESGKAAANLAVWRLRVKER
jgi:hypothetical protein